MFSKLVLATLMSISFASLSQAQTATTKLPKKQNRTTANAEAANYSPTMSMKAPTVEKTSASNAAQSEFAYQPKQGQVAFTVTPAFETSSVQTSVKKLQIEDTTDTRASLLVLRAQRGLANNISWNASVGFGFEESDSKGQNTGHSQGLTDFTFGAQQLREVTLGQMFYGAKVSLSPSDRDEAYSYKSGRSGDGNMMSGGTSLIPYVGMQIDRADAVVGAQAQFEFAFDKSSSLLAADGERMYITRGNQHVLNLEAFYETPTPQFVFGAKAGIAHHLESDTTIRTATNRLELGTDTYQVLNAGIYTKFQTQKNFEVLPSLSFSKLIGNNGGSLSVEEVSAINLGLSVRAAL